MSDIYNTIVNFENTKTDPSIINQNQTSKLVEYLLTAIDNNVEGDVVELGCYVGESSKYLMKTLIETRFKKQLYVYDSFEGLPPLSKYEENSGWKPGTLNTSQDVFEENFRKNKLPIPIITKGWFKDIPDNRLPEKISFAFLDGDFYDSIYDSLVKVYDRVTDGGYICFHDYDRPDLPGVKAAVDEFLATKGTENTTVKVCNQLGVLQKNSPQIVLSEKPVVTLVTGLWNLGRDKLKEGWSRSFEHYLSKFEELLKVEHNLIIFGDTELQEFVNTRRKTENTQFFLRSLEWFKNNDYYNLIQDIRVKEDWLNQSGWLRDSTQATLEMYNPLVMSKVFLLNDAKILDKFNSTHMYWVDAGLANTVHPGYFTHDKVIDKIAQLTKKLLFICFPYDGTVEVHGFKYDALCKEANAKTDMVARAGFFGGSVDYITDFNGLYYSHLLSTLRDGLMGTEESIFTILTYKYPEIFEYAKINNDGLISTFFENIKNNNVVTENCKGVEHINTVALQSTVIQRNIDTSNIKTGLYVITFNSPEQFATLLKSMNEYDPDLLTRTTKFLLDNSTDTSTFDSYAALCKEHNFEHIKKDNIGISGGRQFIAEHFDNTDLEYMMFFEDDMFLYSHPGEVCKNGFNRYVEKFYNKIVKIMIKESYDFLKFSFTEFYGDNSTQWSWYNVPQIKREELWPQYCKLPEIGIDPNSPKTVFNNIGNMEGLGYIDGEIYYCNWPQIVSKEGNKKMFLDTKFQHPFEQTLMSHMYQMTKRNELRSAILLATPIEHDRFVHYDSKLRKEC
jgi:O-methyltransferase